MSKINELIAKYCPSGVEYKELGSVAEVYTGEQFNKRDMQNAGSYPVINGGVLPSGYSDKYNEAENTITVSQGGASAGYVNFIKVNFWLGAHCYAIKLKSDILDNKFVFYCIKQQENKLMQSQEGAGIPSLNRKKLSSILIPVPPLEVQQEIVKILDAFTSLEAELEAELEARKKQYEHYRGELLSFAKKPEILEREQSWRALWEVTVWDKRFNGVDKTMQSRTIKYPYLLADDLFALRQESGNVCLLSTGEQAGWTTEELAGDNICDGEVVTIPWGKSRPVAECMKYYKGKFVTADNRIATSADIKVLNNKFLYYWMKYNGKNIDKLYRGAGIQHPNMKSLLMMKVPVPPLSEQERIVSILDKFDALVNDISVGLPAEIDARRKQYEYYREKLLTFPKVGCDA